MTKIVETRVSEEDLLLYVDGALDDARHERIAEFLEHNPEVRARVIADSNLNRDMKAAFAEIQSGPVPDRLDVSNLQPRRGVSRWSGLSQIAAAIGIAVLAGTAGWQLKPTVQPPQTAALSSFAMEARAAHDTFVVEVAHPVEVEAARGGHLATWLSNRLKRPIKLPDLRIARLELIGGRLLPSVESPAAQLMYQTPEGTRVTVYLRASEAETVSFRFASQDGSNAFFWSDTGFAYALTGDVERAQLLEVAHLLQSQLAE
uniref:anti-sigma factor family protein n=1 Tax=Pararhizobium sp. IMCC3301 TaxID=3067904 RepID=UPI0027427BF0|nr:anti-sigma factor [Pararhizobium sp. IMCC3301]